ncbi:hypothetical protein HAX54_035587, partial [Datura stramonium]|nr:hypothetical protein [Datura stramonium]
LLLSSALYGIVTGCNIMELAVLVSEVELSYAMTRLRNAQGNIVCADLFGVSELEGHLFAREKGTLLQNVKIPFWNIESNSQVSSMIFGTKENVVGLAVTGESD